MTGKGNTAICGWWLSDCGMVVAKMALWHGAVVNGITTFRKQPLKRYKCSRGVVDLFLPSPMSELAGERKRSGGSTPWATVEQRDYLMSLRTEYVKSQAGGKRADFWATVLEYWDKHWPIPKEDVIKANESDKDTTYGDPDDMAAKKATSITARQLLTKVC
jgi:hypothetical protein